MALTNAERQARHRARMKAMPSAGSALTPEQIAERDAVAADPIYPVPPRDARAQMPRFMGWERYEWSEAPLPLIEFFGLRVAWEGWQAEKSEMDWKIAEISRAHEERAAKIIAECGDVARQIMNREGTRGLFRRYEADPTLGQKRKRRVT